MHPDLERLLALQAKDLVLLEAERKLKALDEQVAALDAAVEQCREEAEAAKRRLAEGIQKRGELEKVIEAQRGQQERRRARIEQVRTAREVQALMTEMDAARSVVARSEGEWMKAAEQTQQQETDVKDAEARLTALESDQTGERAKLLDTRSGLELERDSARQDREASAAEVERNLRLRYDRLWGSRLATVVVPLRGDACGACFTAIPRNRRSQIRAGTHIEGCEACGVILYPTDDGAA